MRILYLTESTGWSGGAQQTLTMARALRQKGHELVLGCQPASDIGVRAEAAGVPIERIRMRQDYDLIAVKDVVRALRRLNTEILHAQHPTAHAVGLMAAAWTRIPAFVVTRRVMFRIRRNPFSRLKYLVDRIDGYVAISEAVKSELVAAGVKSSRIDVVPSVVELRPATVADGGAIRSELKVGTAPLIGVIGNYAPFKGQDVMLQSIPAILKRHPNAVVLFAGRGTEAMAPKAEALGVSRSVRLLGFRTDVPKILAALTVFVMPSIEEAAGTALREAMLAGLPVVGTRVGGIPESIKDGQTGLLVPPSDPVSLAEAVNDFLSDSSKALHLAEAGKRFVADHFSVSAAAGRMEAFYTRILESKGL